MALPTNTLDVMLNSLTFTQASLHSAFPGSIGSNELAGGAPAYARKNITMNASSGGSRALSAAVVFDVPVVTVRWVGYWNGAVFIDCAPNGGGVPRNFMAVPSSDIVYSVAHGFVDTNKIVFYNGTPPAGLTEGAVYFVRDSTADTFKVTATSGGVAIDLTAASSFQCVVCGITEDVFAVQGTHTLSTTTQTIPS